MKLWRGTPWLAPIFSVGLACLFLLEWDAKARQPVNALGGLPSLSEADLLVLREEGFPTDGPGLIEVLRQKILGPEELARMERLVDQLGDEEFQKREEATKALVRFGTRARPSLARGLASKDPEIKARCAEALRQIELGNSLLIDGAAIRVLARLEKGKPDSRVDAMFLEFLRPKDNPILLEAAGEALSMLALEWTQPSQAVLEALKTRSAPERFPVLLALLKTGKRFAVDLARAELERSEPESRVWAALALCLSGADPAAFGLVIEHMNLLDGPAFFLAEDVGYRLGEPTSPEPEPVLSGTDREKRVKLWKDWWAKRKDQPLVLREPLTPAGPGGSTTVLMLDLGKIVDLDDKKKPRWQINELEFPLDAQLLPGPRVLVAEHNANRITERDTKGRILWAKGFDEPLAAQRLASGTTVIASRLAITEVDLNGQDLITWLPKNDERIMKMQRRSDGFTAVVLQSNDEHESSRLVWLDRAYRERASFLVQVRKSGGRVDILPGNMVILPEFDNNRIAQFDIGGKVVWNAVLDQPVACVVTPAGTVLANCGTTRGVVEFDRKGKEIWNFQTDVRVTRAWRR